MDLKNNNYLNIYIYFYIFYFIIKDFDENTFINFLK